MSGRKRGVTLLELMVVTAIIAIVLGIGTAFFTGLSRTFRLRAAADQVAGVIRSAASHAGATGCPARVEFDVANGRLRSIGPKPAGLWHFEGGSGDGAFGRDATLGGGVAQAPGRIGDGLAFSGNAVVEGPKAGAFALGEGVAVEAWIRPTSRQDMIVVQVGSGAVLGVSDDLRLLVWFGGVSAQTEPDAVPLHRWSLVRLDADGKTLAGSIDHVERVRVPAAVRWSGDPTAAVRVSDGRRPFAVSIDEVRIESVVTLEEYELGPKLRFETAPDSGELRFDGHGRLDESWHEEDVAVVLVSEARNESKTVRVERRGAIRVLDAKGGG